MRDALCWICRLALIALLLHASDNAYTQSTAEKQAQIKGFLVEEPERLSGLWEAPAGPDSVVGLDITLSTKISGAVTSLANVEQHQEQILFRVYQRHGAELKFGGGHTQWDGKRLIMHFVSSTKDDLAIDIDLTYNEKLETWTGLFHCGSFTEDVTLRRPSPGPKVKVSPMVGTWAGAGTSDSGHCLHIVEQSDRVFAGWQDMLKMPGRDCYANGLKPPDQSREYYGEPVKVIQTDDHAFSIVFGAYSAVCCQLTLTGTVSADNSTLNAAWLPGSLQRLPNSLTWRKVQGNSCRVLPNYRQRTTLPSCPPGTVVK
jgi:hypothetical protein